ncbi:MAG: class A sortase, partial [Clostridium sp.]|nr:class A sortase [Clostridium sp.]
GTLINQNKVNMDLIVGQLVVPSINLNIPIFKGINNTNLLAGSATMREDQTMGKGNYPLAGHYVKDKDVLFGSLMDVKEGDIIRLTDKETIFEYETYEVKLVPDTAVYLIDNQESENIGNPIISLMTCYYSSKTGKRYFVMGELKESYAYTQEALYAK